MSELGEGGGALLECGASRTPKQTCFPEAFKRVIVRGFSSPLHLCLHHSQPCRCRHRRDSEQQRADQQRHEARRPPGSLLPSPAVGRRPSDLLLQGAGPQQGGHGSAGQDPRVRAHGERRTQHTHTHTYVFHALCYVCPLLENLCRSPADDLPRRARKSKTLGVDGLNNIIFKYFLHPVSVTYHSWSCCDV